MISHSLPPPFSPFLSGSISIDELGDALRVKGFNPTSKELVAIARELDVDNSGFIGECINSVIPSLLKNALCDDNTQVILTCTPTGIVYGDGTTLVRVGALSGATPNQFYPAPHHCNCITMIEYRHKLTTLLNTQHHHQHYSEFDEFVVLCDKLGSVPERWRKESIKCINAFKKLDKNVSKNT